MEIGPDTLALTNILVGLVTYHTPYYPFIIATGISLIFYTIARGPINIGERKP